MAEVSIVNVPQADFVTTTLNGAITSASTSFTIGSGLTLDANGGYLQIDYDSTVAVGVDTGPETVAYTSYNSGTGAVTGVTRGQAQTTAVAHNNTASVQCGASAKYYMVGNVLGYAEITANFTSTATPTITDVTSLTVTVTVPAGGRRIRITAFGAYILSTAVSGTTVVGYIREGASTLNQSISNVANSIASGSLMIQYIKAATAGSHTYKCSISQSAAGTMTWPGDVLNPGFIMVELL